MVKYFLVLWIKATLKKAHEVVVKKWLAGYGKNNWR
jgi:hypothetical protein